MILIIAYVVMAFVMAGIIFAGFIDEPDQIDLVRTLVASLIWPAVFFTAFFVWVTDKSKEKSS